MRKYSVGDIVTIKSLDWYNKCLKDDTYEKHKKDFNFGEVWFVEDMKKYCGVTTKISKVIFSRIDCYELECDDLFFMWTGDMFEGVKELRKKKLEKLKDSYEEV